MEFVEKEIYKNQIGIYGIRNKVNNKIYVGQTREKFLRRFLHHQWKLRDHSHDNENLQADWNIMNEDDFEFIVLQTVTDSDELDQLEIYYIAFYKQQGLNYNIQSGGPGFNGAHLSEHAKRLIGEKNRQHMLGRHHSDETKAKMSVQRKGRHITRSTDVLTPELAMQIKTLLIQGVKPADVAKRVGVAYKNVNNIMSNNSWSAVNVKGWDEYMANRKTYTRLSKEDFHEIYRLYIEESYTDQQLAEKYNKSTRYIRKILRDESTKVHENPVPSSIAS